MFRSLKQQEKFKLLTLEELLKVFLVGEEHPRYIIEENLRTFMEKKLIKKFTQSQTHLTQVDTFTEKNSFFYFNQFPLR